MKAPALYKLLAPYAMITDKRALAQAYRSLVLAPDHVRACAMFGVMESEINLGLSEEVIVNAEDFLQVLRSLPDAELEIAATSGALNWTCGPAKGHLGLMTPDREKIEVPRPTFNGDPGEETVLGAFGLGLELGGLACGSMALRTLGLQGVQLRNNNQQGFAYASDDTTISACGLGKPLAMQTEMVTLLPDATNLLAAIIKRDEEALVASNESAVYCITHTTQLLLYQVASLRYDIRELISSFGEQDVKMPLLRESVAAFLRRAEALSDDHQRAVVSISVEEGRTRLVFNESKSSTEEYYLVKGGPNVSVAPINLEAHRLAKALAHADFLVFDYAEKNVLVLRGGNDFTFAIMGRRE